MAAIAWERIEHDRRNRRAPLRLVTAPPSRRRPAAAVYRRRRLVAVLLAVALAVVALQVARAATAAGSAGVTPAAPVVLVAQPGDSYWTLANELHVGGDLRSTVDALVAANGGGDLHAGDRIVLDG